MYNLTIKSVKFQSVDNHNSLELAIVTQKGKNKYAVIQVVNGHYVTLNETNELDNALLKLNKHIQKHLPSFLVAH